MCTNLAVAKRISSCVFIIYVLYGIHCIKIIKYIFVNSLHLKAEGRVWLHRSLLSFAGLVVALDLRHGLAVIFVRHVAIMVSDTTTNATQFSHLFGETWGHETTCECGQDHTRHWCAIFLQHMFTSFKTFGAFVVCVGHSAGRRVSVKRERDEYENENEIDVYAKGIKTRNDMSCLYQESVNLTALCC